MDFAVRLLGPGDVDVFRQIRLEALGVAPEAFASTKQDWESLPDEEWRRRLTGNPVFAAFRAGRPVGIMGLMRQGSSKMAHRANLVMVYVRESERGTGAAKAMLDAALDHAKRSGIRQVELAANAENKAALGFYRREGFREIGTIPAGFIHEGEEVDEVLMVRRLV